MRISKKKKIFTGILRIYGFRTNRYRFPFAILVSDTWSRIGLREKVIYLARPKYRHTPKYVKKTYVYKKKLRYTEQLIFCLVFLRKECPFNSF